MIGSARAAGGGVLSRLWVNAGVTAVGYFVLSFVGDRMLSGSEIAVLWPASGFGAVMLLWATGVHGRAVTLAAIAVGYAAYTVGVSSYSGLTFVFLAVNVLEPASDVAHGRHDEVERERNARPRDDPFHGRAFDVIHREIRGIRGPTERMKRNDMPAADRGERDRLELEAMNVGGVGRRPPGDDDLDRDAA